MLYSHMLIPTLNMHDIFALQVMIREFQQFNLYLKLKGYTLTNRPYMDARKASMSSTYLGQTSG